MSVTRQWTSRAPPMHLADGDLVDDHARANSLLSFCVRGRNASIFCLSVCFRLESGMVVSDGGWAGLRMDRRVSPS